MFFFSRKDDDRLLPMVAEVIGTAAICGIVKLEGRKTDWSGLSSSTN